jgi:transcriptional regulator with PAS, ATPase and Fis domain
MDTHIIEIPPEGYSDMSSEKREAVISYIISENLHRDDQVIDWLREQLILEEEDKPRARVIEALGDELFDRQTREILRNVWQVLSKESLSHNIIKEMLIAAVFVDDEKVKTWAYELLEDDMKTSLNIELIGNAKSFSPKKSIILTHYLERILKGDKKFPRLRKHAAIGLAKQGTDKALDILISFGEKLCREISTQTEISDDYEADYDDFMSNIILAESIAFGLGLSADKIYDQNRAKSVLSLLNKIDEQICKIIGKKPEVPNSVKWAISEIQSVGYKLDLGIASKGIETGKEEAIPKASEEPKFLNHTVVRNKKQEQEVLLICRPIKKMVSKASKSNASILIRGEIGTGKELVANYIHHNSLRSKHPFVKVNCAFIPPDLLESVLLGYEKGAFTGALKLKKGEFEIANKGSIFLDGIESVGSDLQVKLLRILQEGEFERVGGHETIKLDVRIIAATKKNLERVIEDGDFRKDLYYRLNVIPIDIPSLRDRRIDIPLLADHFLEKYASLNHKDIRCFSTQAINMLIEYQWPGNVIELEDCIKRAVLLCEDRLIQSNILPPDLKMDLSIENAITFYEMFKTKDILKITREITARTKNLLKTARRKLIYKENIQNKAKDK